MKKANTLAPLKQVAIVAADHAAEAIAKLTGQEVTAAAPMVRLVAIEEVLDEIDDITSVSSVVVVKIKGDVHGLLVFSLDPDQAQLVVKDTLKQMAARISSNQDQAVLCEMANIVAGAVLGSIATFLALRLSQSPPASTTDMLGAALDPFLAEFGTRFDKVLIQQELFAIPARAVSLKLLVLIDPPSTERMLKKITNKVNSQNAANN
jgi:chemotaxis protein CheY-P-specific phosphatase CheC